MVCMMSDLSAPTPHAFCCRESIDAGRIQARYGVRIASLRRITLRANEFSAANRAPKLDKVHMEATISHDCEKRGVVCAFGYG